MVLCGKLLSIVSPLGIKSQLKISPNLKSVFKTEKSSIKISPNLMLTSKTKMEVVHPSEIVPKVQGKYISYRTTEFDKNRIISSDFSNEAKLFKNGMSVENSGDWLYRKPEAINYNILDYQVFPKERISLNTLADKKLLDVLDRYFANGEIIIDGKILKKISPPVGYYKCPVDNNDWIHRTDPITLYFKEKISSSVIEDIKAITCPFKNSQLVPKTDKVFLAGEIKGADWLSYSKEKSPEELLKQLNEIRKINPKLADGIFAYLRAYGLRISPASTTPLERLYRISAGQQYAIDSVIKDYGSGLETIV